MKLLKPNPPQKLTTSGRKVKWEAPAEASPVAQPTRYLVYVTLSGSPSPGSDTGEIAAYTAETRTLLLRTGKKRRVYDVWVSTLDRYNNESAPAGPVRIRL